MTGACTGVNERAVRGANLPYQTVHLHPKSHAGYYPGAVNITLKLVFNPVDGHIYGAQAIGEDMVEKRIDVIATALQAGITVHDLAELELCYAPPFGSAKDPVNYAGMIAQNIMEGIVKSAPWQQVLEMMHDDSVFFLDVRKEDEVTEQGKLHDKAYNIPVDELRERVNEVPTDKKILVSCVSGQRAYYAARTLMQLGYDVTNFSGAYTIWRVHGQKLAQKQKEVDSHVMKG
eukprot:CAMPEP_0184306220 /NCGR_PEP_ID=MMETSP1049-20130417/15277_1 /TAXON_ID=77928 /ORGANISM="Proteomonas sulcata, Strain CCMP704" /LENGTH=231 /DNA_ID=CAMNT_0026618437 /DNA_START=24 /DNA_END=719 /DNA_ORIENTATION=+